MNIYYKKRITYIIYLNLNHFCSQLQLQLKFLLDLYLPTLLLLQCYQFLDHLKTTIHPKKSTDWSLLLQARHLLHTKNRHRTSKFNYNSRPFTIQIGQIFSDQRNLHWKTFNLTAHFTVANTFQAEKSKVELLLTI